MADCYHHGYSGGPGPCLDCERNERAGREPDDDGPARPVRAAVLRGKTPSGQPKFNNADLPAGSPMYFYCTECGELADVMPEDYDGIHQRLKRVCDACRRLGYREATA
jgi:hypothetical protein